MIVSASNETAADSDLPAETRRAAARAKKVSMYALWKTAMISRKERLRSGEDA